jgi:two-component system phosphate regulon response regulator PhoB
MSKILVVDDEVELVQLCRLVLEDAGYNVRGAYNGEQALKMVNEEAPHLILLDVMMPGMSGIEVCQQIRSTPGYPNQCPIIMYTADDSSETRLKSMKAGANELVSKQTPIFDLASKISSYLRNGSN